MSYLCCSVNTSKDQDIEEILQNWRPPSIRINDVYKRSGIFTSNSSSELETLARFFKVDSSYEIKTVERTVSIQDEYVDLQLFKRNAILQHKRKYTLLHLGLVQVAIKPLTRNGTKYSVLVALRDRRFLGFNNSLLSIAESSLNNGPIYFSCYPGFPVSLKDPRILDILTLNIKVPEFHGDQGSQDIAVVYRHCYKVLNSVLCTKEKDTDQTFDESTFIETNLLNDSVAVPKTVSWDSVEVPDRWR